jgi:dTDP-4-dehydrorhamnose 3,5-epimerase
MKFVPTEIPEVVLVEPEVHRDGRGFFLETYQARQYRDGGIGASFVQDNHSRSVYRTLRGLHAQLKRPQAKLVRVIEGEIFDVAVDLRRNSPTFGRWVSAILSSENFRQCYIPPGFAHGFCVTSEVAQVEYKCSEFYDPADEFSLRWDDPEIGIRWPVQQPILSQKDASALLLRDLLNRLHMR